MGNITAVDKQFHLESLNAIKVQDPTISLAFGLENTERRSFAANLLCLAGELERATRIPKEPMLAAIRVQWWHDTLANDTGISQISIAPLVQRLRMHIQHQDIKRDDILALIATWQSCTMDETATPATAWGFCWQLLGLYLANDAIANIASQIGILLHSTHKNDILTTLLDGSNLDNIRQQARQNRQWWVYFAAIMAHKKQTDEPGLTNDPLLAWRLLGWRFFGFKTLD